MKKSQFAIVLVINGIALLVATALVAFIIVDRMSRPTDAYVPDGPQPPVDPTGLPILWPAPHFQYTAHDGRTVTNQDLKGHVWIADFFYTRCTSACPILTAQLMILQRSITDPNVRFVSFTVDPEHDTPEVLDRYAKGWGGDMSRWFLLATDNQTKLHETTLGMRVAAQKTNDPLDPIMHSNKFVLVDASGNVRGMYDSTDDTSMRRLVSDAALLSAGIANPAAHLNLPNEATVKAGQEIFMSLGCYACHTNERIAPKLNGLIGRSVALADNRTVTADEAYVRESILSPAAKTTAGYPPTMPSYQGYLSDTQVKALTAYIQSLPADTGPTAERTVHVDPVCKMDVSVGPDVPSYAYEGKTYHFCCDSCKDRFEKDPKRFLTPSP